MPAQRTTRTNTTTSRKAADTIAEARKNLAEAHEQGRHRRAVPNCPECEKGQGGNGGNGNAKTSTTKGNGTRSRTPKGVTAPPFRAVTLVTEGYLMIEGQGDKDFDLAACPRCACLLPGGDKPEAAHKAFHEVINGLDQR